MAIPSRNKSFTGTKGIADVIAMPDKLRVRFASGETYDVKRDGWERPNGKYHITLTATFDAIKYVSPVPRADHYLVRFDRFTNRIGQTETSPGIPQPVLDYGGERIGKNGQRFWMPDRMVARMRLTVVENGSYKGLPIIYTIPYIFERYPGTELAMISGTAGQRKQVETFLTAAGLDLLNDEIPFGDGNVLPVLEAKLQVAGKVFGIRLKEDGFPDKDSVLSIPAFMIPPEMLGEGRGEAQAEEPVTA